jgi:hypothetical protein
MISSAPSSPDPDGGEKGELMRGAAAGRMSVLLL